MLKETFYSRNQIIIGRATMSKYVDVDIKIEISGPAKGAITRVILAILAVGIKHGKFVETSDFYRVCLGYNSEHEKELEDLAGVPMSIHDQALYELIVDLACMVSCSYETHKNGYEAGRHFKKLTVFNKLGLQVSYGDYTFCLTLFKKYWNISYEYVREGKSGIYVTKPRIEAIGFKVR